MDCRITVLCENTVQGLGSHGLAPDNIDPIIHSRLHNDHCENDYKCTKAGIVVQRAEYDFFLNPHPLDHRYCPDLLDGLAVGLVGGDANLMDGIDLIFYRATRPEGSRSRSEPPPDAPS
jgi:hypothetical protein